MVFGSFGGSFKPIRRGHVTSVFVQGTTATARDITVTAGEPDNNLRGANVVHSGNLIAILDILNEEPASIEYFRQLTGLNYPVTPETEIFIGSSGGQVGVIIEES